MNQAMSTLETAVTAGATVSQARTRAELVTRRQGQVMQIAYLLVVLVLWQDSGMLLN